MAIELLAKPVVDALLKASDCAGDAYLRGSARNAHRRGDTRRAGFTLESSGLSPAAGGRGLPRAGPASRREGGLLL